jgi:two-component system chemotaxis response regulator CheB
MLRVLIASVVPARRACLIEALRLDPEIEIVAAVDTGAAALAATRRLRPALVVLDARLDDADVLATTKRIMIEAPSPIVVASGDGDPHDVELSLFALRAGALGVVRLPSCRASPGFAADARQLAGLAKRLAEVKLVRRWSDRISAPLPACGGGARGRARIVAIAASTGGPSALVKILSELPANFPVPIFVTQHISAGFIGGFAAWLNLTTSLEIKVAAQGERGAPGTVYVAPDDRHLGVDPEGCAVLSDAPAIGGFRPSATHLFQSVAAAFGASGVAVVLTGMGSDGRDGLRRIHAQGGYVLAQDEATSVVFGMPGAAVEHGLADAVLPLGAIAGRLVELTTGGP